MKYLRWLLFPFSLIYGLVVIIRNWFYDSGVFKSYKFNKPVISVGNLDVGGAGKSPMTEYLIRLLKTDYKLATLSRGYGRKTKGYLVAGGESQESRIKNQEPGVGNQESRIKRQETRGENQELRDTSQESGIKNQESGVKIDTAAQIGDEPAQFKQKFPDITVAVCEKRAEGIKQLLPDHDLIILDDAYQHRAVEPGLSILLFDYNRIHQPNLLLPAGNLREPFSGRWRSQIIIISKCPEILSHDEQERIAYKIEPLPYQSLFFTSIAYQPLQDRQGNMADLIIGSNTTVFLLTGIANANPLVKYLNSLTSHIIHHKYPDHHPFTLKNISKLAAEYAACTSSKKIIITTEKDAQRLEELRTDTVSELPFFVIPIRVEFLNGSGHKFDQLIIDYVREHSTDNSIY